MLKFRLGEIERQHEAAVCQRDLRIRYLAVKAPDAGIMRIRIDGGSWTSVDLYSASTYAWQYVYDSGDIDFDYHLVQVGTIIANINPEFCIA